MPVVSEFRFFDVCLDRDKKDMMLKALNNRIDLLIEGRASEKVIQKTRWLHEEINKMKIC